MYNETPPCDLPSLSAVFTSSVVCRAGMNRVSLGIQSLRPAALLQLGRAHGVGQCHAAIEAASNAFDRYSIDLIYGRCASPNPSRNQPVGPKLESSPSSSPPPPPCTIDSS